MTLLRPFQSGLLRQGAVRTMGGLGAIAKPAARYAQTRSFVASSVRRDSEAQPKESLASASEMHDKLPVPYGPNQLPPFLPNPRNGNYFTVDNPNRVLECIRPLAPNHRYKGRSFSNIWLRDNCRCEQCVYPPTRQRLANTFDIPDDIHALRHSESVQGVHIEWSDGHTSFYEWEFLRWWMMFTSREAYNQPPRYLWGSEIAQHPPTVDYQAAMTTEAGVAQMTDKIVKYGFVFVKNVPYDNPDYTRQLLERIGPIRQTHYGGFYDFIPDMAKADTAYTNYAIPAHTDTTYFSDPAGLQSFHLLEHKPAPGETEAVGGESLLVDGFKVAELLRNFKLDYYYHLAKMPVMWHCSGNDGVTIRPYKLFPVIEEDKFLRIPIRIRWNTADRGVLPYTSSWRSQKDWWRAAKKFDELLKDPANEYKFQLKPGTVLIFNNWRVLHGRTAFTGIRRICGGYINFDDFMSTWRNTNFKQEVVLRDVIG